MRQITQSTTTTPRSSNHDHSAPYRAPSPGPLPPRTAVQDAGPTLQRRQTPPRYPYIPRPYPSSSTRPPRVSARAPFPAAPAALYFPRAPPHHSRRHQQVTYITQQMPLEHEPHFDDPDHSPTTHCAIVLCAVADDLHRAEEQFGRAALYIPRVTERSRPAGRSRVLRTITIFQWPGYAFLHELSANLLPTLISRYYFRHMRPPHPTLIPVSALQPSRHLEITSALDAARPQASPLPPLPGVGDLVSVRAGRWSEFRGVVREVRRGMVVVDVPHSSMPIKAHPTAVTVLDRKKVLA